MDAVWRSIVVFVENPLHDRDGLCSFTGMLNFQYTSIEEGRIFGRHLENLVKTIGGFEDQLERPRPK